MSGLVERTIGHLRRHGPWRALRHAIVQYGLFQGSKKILRFLPEADWVDHNLARFDFWVFHRRLPSRKRRLFNDMFWHVRGTPEINDPLRVFVSDKELVKLYVKAVAGDEYNVPTIAVLRDMEAVRAFEFPRDCCIKPTHGSGQVILRHDGAPIDYDEIASWFGMNYYHGRREQNYRTLRPKVIVEPLIFDMDRLADFKVFCWQGEPRLIQVDMDRHTTHTRKYFDVDWNEQPFVLSRPTYPGVVERPRNLDTMLDVAAKLSSRFSLVRIDLYTDGTRCLVGEITNCQANALEQFDSEAGEEIASRLLFGPARPRVQAVAAASAGVGATAAEAQGDAVVALLEGGQRVPAGAPASGAPAVGGASHPVDERRRHERRAHR